MVENQGEVLIRMCNSTQCTIANGVKGWPNSKRYTWHTTSEQIVIDYHLLFKGMTKEWIENWIKPIHKAGERCIPNNYHTIMVGSTMAKLFETMTENKLSSWSKEKSK